MRIKTQIQYKDHLCVDIIVFFYKLLYYCTYSALIGRIGLFEDLFGVFGLFAAVCIVLRLFTQARETIAPL